MLCQYRSPAVLRGSAPIPWPTPALSLTHLGCPKCRWRSSAVYHMQVLGWTGVPESRLRPGGCWVRPRHPCDPDWNKQQVMEESSLQSPLCPSVAAGVVLPIFIFVSSQFWAKFRSPADLGSLVHRYVCVCGFIQLREGASQECCRSSVAYCNTCVKTVNKHLSWDSSEVARSPHGSCLDTCDGIFSTRTTKRAEISPKSCTDRSFFFFPSGVSWFCAGIVKLAPFL